jgi:hypothetical protein
LEPILYIAVIIREGLIMDNSVSIKVFIVEYGIYAPNTDKSGINDSIGNRCHNGYKGLRFAIDFELL